MKSGQVETLEVTLEIKVEKLVSAEYCDPPVQQGKIPSLADLFLSLSLSEWKIASGYIRSTQSLICPLPKQPIWGQTEATSQLTQIFTFKDSAD